MNSDPTVFGALSAFQRSRELQGGASQYAKNFNEQLFAGGGSIHASNAANATLLEYVQKKKSTMHKKSPGVSSSFGSNN